jgi:hypothetical protein
MSSISSPAAAADAEAVSRLSDFFAPLLPLPLLAEEDFFGDFLGDFLGLAAIFLVVVADDWGDLGAKKLVTGLVDALADVGDDLVVAAGLEEDDAEEEEAEDFDEFAALVVDLVVSAVASSSELSFSPGWKNSAR